MLHHRLTPVQLNDLQENHCSCAGGIIEYLIDSEELNGPDSSVQ